MKYILFIFTITITLSAQYEWSTPVQLSEQGIYPDSTFSRPAITADSNGILYAFWIKGIQIGSDLRWYSQIEYRKSYNDGISWSTTENLTPDYTTERIYDIQALCDSLNNIHLIYVQTVTGSEYSRILHKRFYNDSWQDPVEVYRYYTSVLRTGIDNRNRIYATWFLGPADTGTAYFSFCDVLSDTISWRVAEAIDNTGSYGVRSQLIFDIENNVYCTGSLQSDDVYPYFFEYDRNLSEWRYEQITEIGALACALTISDNEELYAHVSIGGTQSDNDNYSYFKLKSDSIWTDMGYIGSDTSYSDRYLFTDNDDNFHLFEMYYSYPSKLIYTNSSNSTWNTEILHSDSIYGYEQQNVEYKNGSLYLVFKEIDTTMLQFDTKIFFQSKKIFTSIEDCDKLTKDFELFQNYPNPFNNETAISFSIREVSNIELNIFNVKGEIVKSMFNKKMNKGNHSVQFQADELNSGVYYYQLRVNGKIMETKSMLYLK
ncbi:MAG: T9SS type A sorting domain-containing protein [Candidatus Delongbacteria bacterium]